MWIRKPLFFQPTECIVPTTGSDIGFFHTSLAHDPVRFKASEVFVFYRQKNALNDVVRGAGGARPQLFVPA
jgi:hypothetical protein